MTRGYRAIAGAILIHTAIVAPDSNEDLMGLLRVGLFIFGLALIVLSFGNERG